MEHGNIQEQIQALLRRLELADADEYIGSGDPAVQLLELGQQLEDPGLRGTAQFYLGADYYNKGQLLACITHLRESLEDLKTAGFWELLGRSYNMLALVTYYRGDVLGALDSFRTGIKLTEQHACYYACSMQCHNLSTILEDGTDYESCLDYRLRAREYLTMAPRGIRYDALHLSIETLMLRVYLKLGRAEHAARQAEMVRQLYALMPNGGSLLVLLVYLTQYEYTYGDKAKAAELMERTKQALNDCPDILDCFDDCLELALWQAKIGDYDDARTTLSAAAASVASDAEMSAYLRLQLQTCRIQCYEYIGSSAQAERIDALEQYFKLSQQNTKSFNNIRGHMQLCDRLEYSRQEIERLARSAETDSLTGLPNRRKLVEQQNLWFDEAVKNKISFGIGIVDIDHFKTTNDNCGHCTGDQYLQTVADILAAQVDEHQFVARYGGDEFVVLYRSMTDSDILSRAHSLRACVKEQTSCLGFGSVSVSQGVYNAIPTRRNHLWDFTSLADHALYRCKHHGRDMVVMASEDDLTEKQPEG